MPRSDEQRTVSRPSERIRRDDYGASVGVRDRVLEAEYRVAVAEANAGAESERAHVACVELGEAYRSKRLNLRSRGVFERAVMDATRLYGPHDPRTLLVRFRFATVAAAVEDPVTPWHTFRQLRDSLLDDVARDATFLAAVEQAIDVFDEWEDYEDMPPLLVERLEAVYGSLTSPLESQAAIERG